MTYVEREEVRYVRLHDDGTLNLADIEFTSVEGIIPAPGDFSTQIDSDGFFYTIEIVERHRVYEPDRKDHYWALIFRDVDDNPRLDRLATTMLEWSKKTDEAKMSYTNA
jgi:hypothetical protein